MSRTSAKHCATCGANEGDEGVRFGKDRYHCLSCIAARIREWRRRKKAEAAAADAQPEPVAEPAAPEPEPADPAELAIRLDRHLQRSGESWIALARRVEVAPATLHGILTGADSEPVPGPVARRIEDGIAR